MVLADVFYGGDVLSVFQRALIFYHPPNALRSLAKALLNRFIHLIKLKENANAKPWLPAHWQPATTKKSL
jgi:hypothetical protein